MSSWVWRLDLFRVLNQVLLAKWDYSPSSVLLFSPTGACQPSCTVTASGSSRGYLILPLRYIWLSLNALYWNNYSSQSVCQHDVVLCRIVKPFHAGLPPCDCFIVCCVFSKAARKPCNGISVLLCNFSQQYSKVPHRGSQAALAMFCVIGHHRWCWNSTTSRRRSRNRLECLF